MKLSIIVPIYNVAPYLRKCVDSLLMQDISDYEIILVDDGSTDDSGAIADEIVKEAMGNGQWAINESNRPTLRVIHQANAGLSAARNTGIAAAQGEYVCFVDSDDYWQEDVLGELMVQVEREHLDVLRFKYQNVNEKYEVFNPYKVDLYRNDNYAKSVTDGITFLNQRLGTACYAVMYIIRRELLSDCLFTLGIYFEDTDWTPRMLLKAKRIASTDRIVYNYLIRKGSITQAVSRGKQQKVLDDKVRLIASLQSQAAFVREQGSSDAWFLRMISATVVSIIGILSTSFYTERGKYVSKLKRMNVFPIYASSFKAKLINFSPRIAIELFHLKNKK